jgi:hypothetical protein
VFSLQSKANRRHANNSLIDREMVSAQSFDV